MVSEDEEDQVGPSFLPTSEEELVNKFVSEMYGTILHEERTHSLKLLNEFHAMLTVDVIKTCTEEGFVKPNRGFLWRSRRVGLCMRGICEKRDKTDVAGTLLRTFKGLIREIRT